MSTRERWVHTKSARSFRMCAPYFPWRNHRTAACDSEKATLWRLWWCAIGWAAGNPPSCARSSPLPCLASPPSCSPLQQPAFWVPGRLRPLAAHHIYWQFQSNEDFVQGFACTAGVRTWILIQRRLFASHSLKYAIDASRRPVARNARAMHSSRTKDCILWG